MNDQQRLTERCSSTADVEHICILFEIIQQSDIEPHHLSGAHVLRLREALLTPLTFLPVGVAIEITYRSPDGKGFDAIVPTGLQQCDSTSSRMAHERDTARVAQLG